MSERYLENFAILGTDIVEGGGQVLKTVLEKYVRICDLPAGSEHTLNNLILANQGKIFNLKDRNYISKEQLHVLMPQLKSSSAEQADIEQFDITLLCFLLTNVCDLSDNERKHIDTLRKLRNDILAHARKTRISKEECQAHRQNIIQCLKDLARTVSKDFEQEIESTLENLKFRWGSIQILIDWAARNAEVDNDVLAVATKLDNVQAKLHSVDSKVESIIDRLESPPPPMPPPTPLSEQYLEQLRQQLRHARLLFSQERLHHFDMKYIMVARLSVSSKLMDDVQDDILKENPPARLTHNTEAQATRNSLVKQFYKDNKRRGEGDYKSWRYNLIKKHSSVEEPITKWGNTPSNDPRDRSLGANVERMRILQNTATHIISSGEISEEVLHGYWCESSEVMKDVEAVMGRRGYVERLDSIRTATIGPEAVLQRAEQLRGQVRIGWPFSSSVKLMDDMLDDILEVNVPNRLRTNEEALATRKSLLKIFTKNDRRREQGDYTSWMYNLTRKCSSVEEPITKWGNVPLNDPRDRSLGANIERIRCLQSKARMIILARVVSEDDLNRYWSDLEQVIEDVEGILGNRGYSERLRAIRIEQLDQMTDFKDFEPFPYKERAGTSLRKWLDVNDPMPILTSMQIQLDRIESDISHLKEEMPACSVK